MQFALLVYYEANLGKILYEAFFCVCVCVCVTARITVSNHI
jgi:hypothetical protein